MSQEQHQAAAGDHDQAAGDHASQFDPKATTQIDDCDRYLGSCWGENPTEEHKEQADKHRHAAEAHRAGSQALQDAEARSCQGVSNEDRGVSPFFHREAIVEIEPLQRPLTAAGQVPGAQSSGASVVLLPASGVTAARLDRIVQCHIARNASLGNDVPEMSYCPLELKGVTATVTSAGDGFAVNISAEDDKTAAEVLRRALALK